MGHTRFDRARAVTLAAVSVGSVLFLLTLVPGVRDSSGFVVPYDGWLQGTVYVLFAVSAVLPVVMRGRDRAFYGLVAAAVVLRTLGFVTYWAWIRPQPAPPYPSLADLFWVLSDLALLAALLVAVRRVLPGLTRLVLVDAAQAVLTTSAYALALVYPALHDLARREAVSRAAVTTNLAYPLLDVALVALVIGVVTTLKSRAAPAFRLVMLAIVGYAAVDTVFVFQVAAGTFHPGSWLGGASLVATAAMATAAWFARPPADVDARVRQIRHSPLLLPVLLAVACTVLFAYDAFRELPGPTMVLAAVATLLVIFRGVGTLTSDRDRSSRAIRASDDERLRFQALVEASSDLIAIADLDGRVSYVNPAGRRLVGFPPDVDVTQTTISDYFTEESNRYSEQVSRPIVLARGLWEGEMTVRDHRGGPPTPVAVSSFLMRHPETGEAIALGTVQRDISERVAASRALEELAEQRADLLDRLVRAEEAERARIAADVHDDSVQALAVVDLRLGLLTKQLGEASPEQSRTLHELRESVSLATSRLRELLFDLEAPTTDAGLASALTDLAAHLFQGTDVRWEISGDSGPGVSDSTLLTAHRIAKEAMLNACKHAGASRVDVRVETSEQPGGVRELRVVVADDGRGFGDEQRRERPGHLGLSGMADRAAVAGGTLTVDSAPGRGTTVDLRLPLDR